MTCILTTKGTTPEGKFYAEINGIRYIVPPAQRKDLDSFRDGSEIEYNETNGIITRLWKPKKVTQKAVPVSSNGKNEKLIVYQHNFGIVAEVFLEVNLGDETLDFDTVLAKIYTETKKISDQMMQDCGAGQ
jgi:hypothetical protein